ncbi:ATP-dependent metallopeptidase FtsH/Yme1/Tma family protein [Campylobacter pinnipediorum]|uniref:AAA family ATPase n=1 Tax=Campylobacter pinnipediorum subsp. pinnipediorum TaxID=1660067 RepID=A0AAX0LBR1_9BACT|nr:ATP-dependent metallopeptidase FtsH/Yme1/Tma family protein [Campylobacter pinnipediorum]AQW82633.1 integral membrane ATP-dependent zinc metallopeptidase [Campylobacter pinnipediorum subsp. pinnipediorum]OPA78985.1 AAA family ATPase [Campylobacter pinnipediorum subsp. pinnipediorum]
MQKFKFEKKNIAIIALVLLIIVMVFAVFRGEPKNISYVNLDQFIKNEQIQKAVISGSDIIFYTQNNRYKIIKDAIDIKELAKTIPIEQEKQYIMMDEVFTILFLLVMIFMFLFVLSKIKTNKANHMSKNPVFELENMVQSSINPVVSNINFSNVAGIKDVKIELSEIVDFLKNPSKYKEFGIKMPKGVLMVGPPGVGKTLIAKAVAGEANVPFFYQNGASFVQIYVGMGAKRVRELFAKAKAYAPSIVFIDEIDAVGKSRGGDRNDEREATLNQLLTEMDGFLDNSGVIVIAATNRIEMIDEALLRSGRFDRRIFLSMPNVGDRKDILKSYLSGKTTNVDIEEIAKMTVGFSGAALSTLVNEAAINALRRGVRVIETSDFEAVLNKVLLGKKRVLSYTEHEKKIQSMYQGAKALSAYWFDIKFDKISLIEDRFLGAEREIESKTQMLSRIKVYLAGMVKLELEFNDVFSNSYYDLNIAKSIAEKMVFEYGMGQSFTSNVLDVENILKTAKTEIAEFLQGMKTQSEDISNFIFENESIDRFDVSKILNKTYD